MSKKPIVISMGEPSGISSEIIIKVWKNRIKDKIPPFFLIDDKEKIRRINNHFELGAKIESITDPKQTFEVFNNFLPILDMSTKINFTLGKPNMENSKHILLSLSEALKLVVKKKASSLLTLPVCKKTLKEYGFNFNGQTEYISSKLKKITKSNFDEIMILSTRKPIDNGKNLIVGLVTTHIPTKEIFRSFKKQKIIKKLLALYKALKDIWYIKDPHIGITSINPHAGEGGLIGNEEEKIIKPIVKEFKDKGFRLSGPLSNDSCFFKTNREPYDAFLCFHHDQGLTPIKILDFHNSINVTGGIPILRVSPDHGPAFDIAKKNKANIASLIESLKFLESRK